jgi:1-aminocyclopropane-1-carboxylate deaminase/D-cysteine desulfhydrase-like pyridoxal-dependent ACC family enzyme
MNIDSLTPIQEYDDILFKRDDLFVPFLNSSVNGSKLRQCIKLIDKLKDDIRKNYNNKLATSCNLKSPQGYIVAIVAKEFGMKSFIGYSNTKNLDDVVKENDILQNIINIGGDVHIIAKMGLETNMQSKLKAIIKSNKDNFYIVKFGINAGIHSDCIVDSVSNQVRNLPDVDNLIITVGSGITAAGILTGLVKFNKKIKNIYCVQPFGYDRMKTIESIFPNASQHFENFNYIKFKSSYNTEVNIKINDFELDNIYEAKVYKWFKEFNLNGQTLFYIIGNSNSIRKINI